MIVNLRKEGDFITHYKHAELHFIIDYLLFLTQKLLVFKARLFWTCWSLRLGTKFL